MSENPHSFFEAVFAAGAILSGFCGTFLSFRLQREANYYRQPALDFKTQKAVDIVVNLTHFTSAFCLLILATLCATIFGFVLPLFAISGSAWLLARHWLVVAGLVATQILLVAYFLAELRHYKILRHRLANDKREEDGQKPIAIGAISFALAAFPAVWWWFGS
jgi:hypothetical protein